MWFLYILLGCFIIGYIIAISWPFLSKHKQSNKNSEIDLIALIPKAITWNLAHQKMKEAALLKTPEERAKEDALERQKIQERKKESRRRRRQKRKSEHNNACDICKNPRPDGVCRESLSGLFVCKKCDGEDELTDEEANGKIAGL